MRINQFIAHAGICARRAAETLIRQGKITVNGTVCRDLAYRVQPHDVVTYQDKVLTPDKKHYILLHKPPRYVTTLHDPEGRPTVMDLVDLQAPVRLYPVGRLDYMTTGLLLLTNDGVLTTKLAHPSQEILKVYRVTLDRPLSPAHAQRIRRGVMLDDGPVPVHTFTMLRDNQVTLSIHVGRNRIIRRLFSHLGYRVQHLTRTKYAFLTCQNLPEGTWRRLSSQEVTKLQQATQRRRSKGDKKKW